MERVKKLTTLGLEMPDVKYMSKTFTREQVFEMVWNFALFVEDKIWRCKMR